MRMSSFCSRSGGRLRWPTGRLSDGPLDRLFLYYLPAFAGAAVFACLLGLPVLAPGFTSESPEVQQMLGKACAFLEKSPPSQFGVGAECLTAMALLKAGKDPAHPRVQSAVASARKLAQTVAQSGVGNHCYHEALACLCLYEVDPKQYAYEIGMLAQEMVKRQRPNGAWSYNPYTYDDTSQTQYGVLCCWAAHHAGVPLPASVVESAAQWLMQTQRPDGSWAYRATDQPTHSMSAAALSSLYICAHLMGLGADAKGAAAKEGKPDLPPALQKIEKKEKRSAYLRPSNTNGPQVFGKAAGGNAWFAKNLNYDVTKWTHYYMYAVERYKGFQELVEGKTEAEPDWYNAGVEHLQKTQSQDGSWNTDDAPGSDRPIHTAFAVLFLTRSSQKAIKKATLDEGVLIGGMGLPKDLTNARMQDGKVVTPQMVRDVDDLLELLSSAEDKDFDARTLPGGLSLDADLTKRTSQLERLRALVTNENFEARLAAVKTLARSRELDNVPALIFALSDPNWLVVEAARDGLCFISRKFQGYGPPPNATPEQKQTAQAKWKQWYLAIRPDGQLMD